MGIFPKGGNGEYPCLDMIGNVWEWTRSMYKPYPYQPGRDREDLNAGSSTRRVVRGGAFLVDQGFARCASRGTFGLDSNYVLGFRVVVSPFFY